MTFDGEIERLSAAAQLDLADFEAREKAAEALAKHEPPRRSPATVTRKQLDKAIDGVIEIIASEVKAMFRRLEERVAALEAKVVAVEMKQLAYAETWTAGRSYSKGQYATHGGSLWIAMRDYAEGPPGTPKSGFKLAVKRGSHDRS